MDGLVCGVWSGKAIPAPPGFDAETLESYAESTFSKDGMNRVRWFYRYPRAQVEWLFGPIAMQRMLRVGVALQLYRREYGAFPENLEHLVGDYFDALPLDPVRGKPFFYSSQGVDEALELTIGTLEPGTAFLWLPRGHITYEGEFPKFRTAFVDGAVVATGWKRILKFGSVFPLR